VTLRGLAEFTVAISFAFEQRAASESENSSTVPITRFQ
jgi:hypothetical protein